MTQNFRILKNRAFAAFIVLTVASASPLAVAAQDSLKASAPAVVSVSGQELAQDISLGIMKVPEFLFLQQEAQRMGVKVYLFGGTASSFAHYVRWDMMRKKGDKRLLEERFDYDMVDIFRNNQDFDIVIDGDADQVQKLQDTLEQKFPHKQGYKSAWEVRSLRHAIGPKTALLGNPDFLNQHTDSNSTGLIDLTPGSNDIIKDLRDWNSPRSQFYKDLVEGKIHFYYSDKHDSTAMARQGNNPAIVSVVRLLVKALQFDLEIRAEDMPNIQNIIKSFSPASIQGNTYLQSRLANTALKLVQNSVNVERTMNLLDQLELRKKLVAVATNQGAIETALLLSKEPLRTKTLGTGSGKTAQEMGLSLVSHDTMTLEAYYSILRSPTGEPNVFISRDKVAGETAVHGNGFYVAAGNTGATTDGLTIRFRLAPNAREGSDFHYIEDVKYLVILNKKALQVIPELTKMPLMAMVDYYVNNQLDSKDRAVQEKILRKIKTQIHVESPATIEKLQSLLLTSTSPGLRTITLLSACAAIPKCYDERIQKILASDKVRVLITKNTITELLELPTVAQRPDLASKFVDVLQATAGKNQFVVDKAWEYVVQNDRPSQAMVLNELSKFRPDVSTMLISKLRNFANFPEIADAIAASNNTHLINDYVQTNSKATQDLVINKLAQQNASFVLTSTSSIELTNRPGLLPAFIAATKRSKLSTDELNALIEFSNKNTNHSEVALQLAAEIFKKNPSDAHYYLSRIELKNRADLLPVMLKTIQAIALRAENLQLAIQFAKANPKASIELSIAKEFTQRSSIFGAAFISVINMANRSDLLPVILDIVKTTSFEGGELNPLINFGKSNLSSAPQIEVALRQRSPSHADAFVQGVGLKAPVCTKIFGN